MRFVGMGGGSASSRVASTMDPAAAGMDVDLDFNAVQRGDAEMENRMNRVIRGCVDLGPRNPIASIHDQVGVSIHHENSALIFALNSIS